MNPKRSITAFTWACSLVPILSHITVFPTSPMSLLPQVFGLTVRTHFSPLQCVQHPYSSHSWIYFPNNIVTHMPITRQRLCKHIPKHTRSTIGYPLLGSGPINTHSWQQETVFSVGSVPWSCKRAQSEEWTVGHSRVEAGSNTSTVTLRVVGGDEKGSLESETVKYGRESYGVRTRKWLRWRGPAAIVNDRPVLSSERTPHINKPATVWQ
jgi:hypothetical protein